MKSLGGCGLRVDSVWTVDVVTARRRSAHVVRPLPLSIAAGSSVAVLCHSVSVSEPVAHVQQVIPVDDHVRRVHIHGCRAQLPYAPALARPSGSADVCCESGDWSV